MRDVLFNMMFAVSVLTCFAGAAFSQAVEEENVLLIGLDETIRRALDASEELKIKDSEVSKSRGVYRQARSSMLPNVSASGSWTRNAEYPSTAEKTDYAMEGGIAASQIVWSFGKVMYAVDSAKRAVEAGRYSLEAGKHDVIYAAKLCYYGSLLAKDSLRITEKSYSNVLENKGIMEKRAYGGRNSKYDIIRMNAELAARVPAVNEARAQLDTALETLKQLIDADPGAGIILRGEFAEEYPDYDHATLAESMNVSEPSLKSYAKLAEAADLKLKSDHAGLLPVFSAFTGLSRSGGSNENRIPKWSETDRYWSIGLRASVPLWEGGLKEAQISQAKADKEIADLRVKQARKALFLELKKAYVEYTQYKANLVSNNEAVDLAQEAFKQSQDMFESGQISITDLNNAESLLTSQRLNKEMTLYNINVTLAKIDKLIAKSF